VDVASFVILLINGTTKTYRNAMDLMRLILVSVLIIEPLKNKTIKIKDIIV